MRVLYCAAALLLAVIAFENAAAVNVVGIDFGSEWIKVAMVKAGAGVQIVLNDASKRKSPNVLGIDQDFRSWGDVALSKPHLAYGRVRQLMGKRYNESYLASFPPHYYGFSVRNSTDRGSFGVVHHVNASLAMEPEEITAMVMAFVAEMSAAHGKEPVNDVVITVPSYFAQFERQAMMDAAEIAGLNVLSLLSDHTAVALKFGIDHKVENLEKPINVLFYNMGSSSTVVSIVTFSAIPDKDAGKNKTQGELQVRAVAWDTTLGGFTLTSLVVDEIVEKSGKGEELAKRPRNMGKLRKEAEKTKQVLSANKEAMTMIESLIPDYDFKGMLTREDLEKAATKSNYWNRVIEPVKDALKQANMEVADIDRIEMVGGGWRVPRVQDVLKSFFDPTGAREDDKSLLSQTLNADESFCYGAALYAASLSTAFRLRKFSVNDITSFSVSIDLDASGGAIDAEEEEESATEAAAEAPAPASKGPKNIKLFKKGHKIPSKRRMRFKRDDDFAFRMKYDNIEELPPNSPTLIGSFNVTGISAAVAKYPNATKPQVNIAFRLLRDGMVEVEGGEAVLEETVEVEECDAPKKKKKETKKKVATDVDKLHLFSRADENKDDFLSQAEFQTAAKAEHGGESEKVDEHAEGLFVQLDTDKDGFLTRLEYLALASPLKEAIAEKMNSTASAEKTEKTEEEGEEKTAEEKDGEEAPKDDAAAKNETAEAAPEKPVCRMKPQKRIHRAPLKITLESGGFPPMSTKQKRASRKVLQEFEERERLQKEKAQAHNDLESYTYAAREKLDQTEFQNMSSAEQRTAIEELVTKTSAWLDEESHTGKTADFKEKLRYLKDLVDPVLLRIHEGEARSKAVSDARGWIKKVTNEIASVRKTKEWLTDADAKEVEDRLEKFEKWLNESEDDQAARKLHETPAFLSSEIPGKFEPISTAFRRFERIPKPKPPPKPKKTASNSTSTDNSTVVNVTAPVESDEAPAPEDAKSAKDNTASSDKADNESDESDESEQVSGEATFNTEEGGSAAGHDSTEL